MFPNSECELSLFLASISGASHCFWSLSSSLLIVCNLWEWGLPFSLSDLTGRLLIVSDLWVGLWEASHCFWSVTGRLLNFSDLWLGGFLFFMNCDLDASHCFWSVTGRLLVVSELWLGGFSLFLTCDSEASHCFWSVTGRFSLFLSSESKASHCSWSLSVCLFLCYCSPYWCGPLDVRLLFVSNLWFVMLSIVPTTKPLWAMLFNSLYLGL